MGSVCIILAGISNDKVIKKFISSNVKNNEKITIFKGNSINTKVLNYTNFNFVNDVRYFKNFKDNNIDKEGIYFFGSHLEELVKEKLSPSLRFKNINYFKSLGGDGFSLDFRKAYHGTSIVYVMLQYARIFQFDRVYIVGMKYDYGGNITRSHNKTNADLPDIVISRFIDILTKNINNHFILGKNLFFDEHSIYK